jgi:hypothetical protein
MAEKEKEEQNGFADRRVKRGGEVGMKRKI